MGNLSKYDVLNLLAKKMPFFAATQWLKNPHAELKSKAPSDLMKAGDIDTVHAQLEKDIKAKQKNG